jgi:iron complex outermembrane receptor protein
LLFGICLNKIGKTDWLPLLCTFICKQSGMTSIRNSTYWSFIILLVSLFALATSSAKAQTSGSIRGRVTTTDGEPVEAVSVGVQGQTFGSITDSQGSFTISNVPAGSYTVAVSAVGLKAAQQSVTVTAGQRTTLDFRLTESAAELQEVIVQGARTNKFNRSSSVDVAKMPLKNLETRRCTPQWARNC